MIELKNKLQPFNEALEAFIQLIFNPELMINSSDKEIIKLQQKVSVLVEQRSEESRQFSFCYRSIWDYRKKIIQIMYNPYFNLFSFAISSVQYVDELFSLGELKIGACNIFNDYICSVWRKWLQQVTSASPELGDIYKTQLMASLSTHKRFILQACTFGTVHRKNLRFIVIFNCV